MRLLIVDDDPQMRHLLVSLLGLYGVRDCLTANDAREAAALLANERFDGMLLDLHMPGVNGVELLRAVRAQPEHAELPVMVISGDADDQRIAAVAELGIADFLLKPLRPVTAGVRLQRFISQCRERTRQRA